MCAVNYFFYIVQRPSPPAHSAFYTSDGNAITIEPRDNFVIDENLTDEGSGEHMNVQFLTYGYVIKLFTNATNKTSYCPVVSLI